MGERPISGWVKATTPVSWVGIDSSPAADNRGDCCPAGGATSDRFAARGSRLLPAPERTAVDDLTRLAVRDWDPVCDDVPSSGLMVAGCVRITGRQMGCDLDAWLMLADLMGGSRCKCPELDT
ncbi:hypothetical protein CPLU01_08173 [Colletotrichum plurivorum]|uniref:Uncharacterized protein n=1 Tax=Colletotrichum plurivorum TaxID=2175906 RepID=A0A8H6ND90_9PEZI|nr:hypothetical protein CPLU01_08173 [Colletotrichum plurivorum]